MTALGKQAPHSAFANIPLQTTVPAMDKHTTVTPD